MLNRDLRDREATAVRAVGAAYVDLTDYICDSHDCPIIVDDLLVYRDVNHLTATYARYLEPALAATLLELLR